jgi:iron complex outermembrane receptor protein
MEFCMPHPFRLNAIASLFVAIAPGAFAAEPDQIPQDMNVVIVSGSRVEHTSFDFPAAIDVVDAARIQDNQMRVNVSEALSQYQGW